MNEKAQEVFLCPDCGGPSMAAGDGNAICSDCSNAFPLPEKVIQKSALPAVPASKAKGNSGAIQRNIVLKSKGDESLPEGGGAPKTEEPAPVLARSNFEDLQKEHGKRRRKLKKRAKIPAKVFVKWIAIWILTVGTILFVAIQIQNQFAGGDENSTNIEERLEGEELEFFRREYPQILSQFGDFARARNASEMAEYTRESHQLTRKMGRFLRENSMRRPSSGVKPNPAFWNVAYEESPGFVEVVWDGKDKGMFEGVFVKKGAKWLLDWEQFVRYSSASWSLFHDNIGTQRKGIFRVYVEKVSEGEGEDFEPWMEVKLLPPVVDEQLRDLERSEVIRLQGEDGLFSEFSSVFADLSGRSEGFSQLWKRDPRELRRVTVELEWQTDLLTGEERMVIKRLLAKNWRTFEAGDE